MISSENRRLSSILILLFFLFLLILFSPSCRVHGISLDTISRKQLPDGSSDRLLDLFLLFGRAEDSGQLVGDMPRHPLEAIHQICEDAPGELPAVFGQVGIIPPFPQSDAPLSPALGH